MTVSRSGKVIPWLRPSGRAEKTIQAAYAFARADGQSLARSKHLLLALVAEPQSFSALLLARLGVSPSALSAALARAAQGAPRLPGAAGSEDAAPSEQDWTQNRADLLEPARQAAQRLGDKHVGTEHLLLGLLDEPGIAGQALRSLDVTWARAYAALPTLQAAGPPRPIP